MTMMSPLLAIFLRLGTCLPPLQPIFITMQMAIKVRIRTQSRRSLEAVASALLTCLLLAWAGT